MSLLIKSGMAVSRMQVQNPKICPKMTYGIGNSQACKPEEQVFGEGGGQSRIHWNNPQASPTAATSGTDRPASTPGSNCEPAISLYLGC